MSEFTSVTRCPYCKTSFHLGPQQLHAANGTVRCGACLNTFDARAHFLVEQKYLFGSPEQIEPAPISSFEEPVHDLNEPVDDCVEQEETPQPDELDFDELLDEFDELEYVEEDNLSEEEEAEPYSLISDFHHVEKIRKGSSLAAWILSLLLLVSLIPLQIMWWQPPQLLAQTWYQSLLTSTCRWFPCGLSGFKDLDYLTLNGVIQPSDSHDQVLIARLELRNQGPIAQPFPDLALRFTDLKGEVVSARYFTPSDYLRDQSRNWTTIPAHQRVHIQLQIYDPDLAAIGYEFEPLYRESSGVP